MSIAAMTLRFHDGSKNGTFSCKGNSAICENKTSPSSATSGHVVPPLRLGNRQTMGTIVGPKACNFMMVPICLL